MRFNEEDARLFVRPAANLTRRQERKVVATFAAQCKVAAETWEEQTIDGKLYRVNQLTGVMEEA